MTALLVTVGKTPALLPNCVALEEGGVTYWRDKERIHPGGVICDEISAGIRYSRRVLLCCSETALNSWWGRNEVKQAFEKERRILNQLGKRVHVLIPLLLDRYLLDGKWDDGNASEVRSRCVLDFAGWEKDTSTFHSKVTKLICILRREAIQ